MFWPQRCWWTDRVHPLVIGFLIESPSPTCTDRYHKSLNRVLCGWFEPSREWQRQLRCALLAYAPAKKKKKKRMDIQAALFYDLELSSVTADINWVYGIWPLNKTIIRNTKTYFWVGWPTQLVYCALSIKFANQTFKEIHLKELTFFSPKATQLLPGWFFANIWGRKHISVITFGSVLCAARCRFGLFYTGH